MSIHCAHQSLPFFQNKDKIKCCLHCILEQNTQCAPVPNLIGKAIARFQAHNTATKRKTVHSPPPIITGNAGGKIHCSGSPELDETEIGVSHLSKFSRPGSALTGVLHRGIRAHSVVVYV